VGGVVVIRRDADRLGHPVIVSDGATGGLRRATRCADALDELGFTVPGPDEAAWSLARLTAQHIVEESSVRPPGRTRSGNPRSTGLKTAATFGSLSVSSRHSALSGSCALVAAIWPAHSAAQANILEAVTPE
jgi:hypothetical protein